MADRKKGRGCFFWGCLTLVILGIVLAALLGGGGYFLFRQLDKYAAREPVPVPAHPVEAAEVERVEATLSSFAEARGEEPPRLELTGDDLNTLIIGRNPELSEKVYFRVEDDTVSVVSSLPISAPLLGKRYINAELELKPKRIGDKIEIDVVAAQLNDEALPPDKLGQALEQFLKVVGESEAEEARQVEDLAAGLESLKALLGKAKTVEVENGRILIERGSAPPKSGP